MPVFHFTFHAFGTWLPDRNEGYTRRKAGWQPPSSNSADLYRKQMNQTITHLSPAAQQHLINALIECQPYQRFTLYAIATDPAHIHTIAAWTDDRDAVRVRSQLKYKLTRSLNQRFGKKKWLASNAGQTPVKDTDHLHYLVHDYLPKHDTYWYYKQDKNKL